jgi:uncharacterized YigZ family protein
MEYRTVEHQAEESFIERRSEFIGHCKPVQTEEEAIAFINQIKKQHSTATHNVYAYVLRENHTQRFSDDGEPQGTAGTPVLNVMLRKGLVDCVVVVTRYFGGVLLGAGGLIRAYGHGASLAVDAAKPITMILCDTGSITCDYGQYGKLQGVVAESGALVEDAQFTDVVEMKICIPQEKTQGLQKALTEASCGTVELKLDGEKWQKFDVYYSEEEEQ